MTRRALSGLVGLLLALGLVAPACSISRGSDVEATSTAEGLLSAALFFTVEDPSARIQDVPASSTERRALHVLSDGCRYDDRGIPRCGALLGAAYGSNTDPLEWERSTLKHPLGVHRTYWAADDVSRAVEVARDDLQHDRLPWISFKLPHDWAQMAAGAGDDWARELASLLAQLDGPVWLAFHHEPEGDPQGSIKDWTAMQARLAPIVRATAPNVAYSIIVTGYHQLYGEPKYSLSSIWPKDTTIDLVGFDVYDKYGVEKNGSRFRTPTAFESAYFSKFRQFALDHDVAWGLAETGQTDLSARRDPLWVQRTFSSMRRYGGVGFVYFDSTLNSAAPWRLKGEKEQRFAGVLRMTPTL